MQTRPSKTRTYEQTTKGDREESDHRLKIFKSDTQVPMKTLFSQMGIGAKTDVKPICKP